MLKLNNIFILTNLKNFLILEFKTAKKVKYSFLSFCKFKLFFYFYASICCYKSELNVD